MATYAAFKHVELHKVGCGKNRVPSAPRGCIGEIFGDGSNGNSKGNGSGNTPTRPKDTHSRLFGPADPPAHNVRDNLKSNISFGAGEEHAQRLPSNGSSNGHTNGRVANGQTNGHHDQPATPKEGNPLSGEGYKSMNGEINTVIALNSNGSSPVNHNRIPPGGYSSGLW